MTEIEDMLNQSFTLEEWFNHMNSQVPNLEGFCGPDPQWILNCLKLSPFVSLCQTSNQS